MKISKKTIYIIMAIITLIILVLIVVNSGDQEETTENMKNVNYGKLDEIVFNVKTSKAFVSDLVIKISANGIIKANKELEVSSNISGVIDRINIYEGCSVKKGDLMLQLDNREYEIAYNEAKDQMMTAKVEYGLLSKDLPRDSTSMKNADIYYKKLSELEDAYKKNEISKDEYSKRKDQIEMKIIFTGAKREEYIRNKSGMTRAENALKKAELKLQYTMIRAEFDGVVGDFDLVKGTRINTGDILFKLFENNIMKIDVNILESEISKIKLGNVVEIEIPAIPNKKFQGKIKRISPFINTLDGTCKIEIEIKNSKQEIKPGMFAKVLIETNTLKERLLVKKEALLVRDKRNLVFIVSDSLAKWKYVKIGAKNEKYIEILDGIKKDDDVIISGHYNLAHDSKVKVIE